MTGCRYWRLKRRMTLQEVAQRSGRSAATILHMERSLSLTTSSMIVADLARVLGVTMDELMTTYPDDALVEGDHPLRQVAVEGNLLGRYRVAHNLTYQELAARLGQSSKQHAQIVCNYPQPPQRTLIRLAEHEGITVDEFVRRYMEGG